MCNGKQYGNKLEADILEKKRWDLNPGRRQMAIAGSTIKQFYLFFLNLFALVSGE